MRADSAARAAHREAAGTIRHMIEDSGRGLWGSVAESALAAMERAADELERAGDVATDVLEWRTAVLDVLEDVAGLGYGHGDVIDDLRERANDLIARGNALPL